MNSDKDTSGEYVEESAVERDDAVIAVAFRRSLIVAAVLAVGIGGFAVWYNWPTDETITDSAPTVLPEISEDENVETPELLFKDVTDSWGISFKHENGAYGDKLLPETMGGGCAIFDFDTDGDQDILFVNSRRWDWDPRDDQNPATMTLYRNDGSGQFEDATKSCGLQLSLYGMGAAVGDYDNDGDPDLYITAVGMNRLFRNDDGVFVDVTEDSGAGGAESDWSTGSGWFDYDSDGDLDLFVCNYVRWSKDYDLNQNFQLTGGGRAYGRPQDFEGAFCSLFRNEGDGKFRDVGADAGIHVENPATGDPMGKSLGLSFADVDRDGWMDVIVANDTVQNFLFHNKGDGTFIETATVAGIAYDVDGRARGAMGTDIAWFRNDDTLGLAIGNFATEMTALYVARDYGMQFTDEAVPSGLGPQTLEQLTFGVFFFDCDLDGRMDLFAANGHLEEDINKVQTNMHYRQSPQLFWNCRGTEAACEFLPVPEDKSGSDFSRPLVGRGASYGDLDGDGDLDLLITTTGDRPRLLRNDQETGHHWVRIQPVGTRVARDALGTIVEVRTSDGIQRQQLTTTRSYLAQSERVLTFGLGEATEIESVELFWTDGSRQRVSGLAVDSFHVIEQSPAGNNGE